MPNNFEFDEELLKFCDGITGLVEATDCERQFLWQTYAVEAEGLLGYTTSQITLIPRVRWFGSTNLLSRHIGTIDERPIWVQFARATIGGSVIIFWTVTSELADFKMAKKYLDGLILKMKAQVNRTDAINFHNAF